MCRPCNAFHALSRLSHLRVAREDAVRILVRCNARPWYQQLGLCFHFNEGALRRKEFSNLLVREWCIVTVIKTCESAHLERLHKVLVITLYGSGNWNWQ